MYLRELFILNNGPIKNLQINFAFDSGRPLPHVIVGQNGSGKTNLLSIIADALLQGASKAFVDVLEVQGVGRPYFRILGPKTLTTGETFGLSILRFDEGPDNFFYHERIGEITESDFRKLAPESLQSSEAWRGSNPSKDLIIEESKSEAIFESGVYTYFPSSRAEYPHWFNIKSVTSSDSFNTTENFRETLGRPLFIERGLNELAQWLMGVLAESRLPVDNAEYKSEEKDKVIVELDAAEFKSGQQPLVWANSILQIILDDPGARFFWAGRYSPRKIGIETRGQQLIAGLNSLSGGQATLLTLFGTLLRYGDATRGSSKGWRGIVIIDELDAHMHIDLQVQALPKLLSLFPDIQFIVSSHSPFFALGMERQFRPQGVRVIALPTGTRVAAEAYEEFQKALDAFRETELFTQEVTKAVDSGVDPLVILAGETDLIYFRTAARLLGFTDLEPMFEWVGQANKSNGGGIFTGDSSLVQTVRVLRANPQIAQSRTIVVVFDCDARQMEQKFQNLHILSIPEIPDALCKKGIENILPSSVFVEEMYETKEVAGDYGRPTITHKLRKMFLCETLCGPSASATTFENFRPILQRINEIVAGVP